MKRKKIIVLITVFTIVGSLGILTYTSCIKLNKSKENTVINNGDKDMEFNNEINVLDTDKKAQVIRNVTTSAKILSISFEGIDDNDTMTNVLELLDKYKVKATFIVSGIDSAENPDILNQIKDEGHEIGNASLNYKINVDDKSKEELIYDFSKSNKIIEDIINDKVNLLKCKSETYSDELLEAAYACGNEYVLDSDIYLNYQSFKNYEEAYGYVNRLKNGSILSIKLNGVLDETEYTNKTNNEKPAIDKESGIKEKDIEEKHQVTTFEMLEWLLRAISQNKKAVVKVTDLANIVPDNNSIFNSYTSTLNYNYRDINTNKSNHNGIVEDKNNSNNAGNNEITDEKAEKPNSKYEVDLNSVDFKNLIDINDKRVVDINSEIYTTKNSVTYTFKGLSNENTSDYVLESLKQINGHGTFFFILDEIEKYPERINKIIEYGNEIGNGGVTNNTKLLSKSTEDIAKEIYEVGIMLKNRGIKTNAYMPGYGYVNENVREALSSLKSLEELKNYELFTYTKSPVITKYKRWKSDEIINDYFNINTYLSLRKGEVVYFRLDSDLFDDYMTVGNMITNLTENYVENGYIHRFDSKTNLYVPIKKKLGYSVVTLNELQEIDDINSKRYSLKKDFSALPQRTVKEADAILQKNYIGNIYVDLHGFNEEEQAKMDTEGFVNTNGESAVFFTFDDWGSDVVINDILDVLDKHNVKGTFFALGKYVDIESNISNANPNLLRTIALRGHDIGSHTYDHDKLDTDPEELKISLNKSHMVMDRVIGDLGSLKPYLRPPTLYINKSGLETAFQCGFDYVINGNISTHDYEAASGEELLEGLESELVKKKGNIVVMHMNNQASYTAEALDKFLTKNEQGIYGERYRIAKLSDYLN